MVGEGKFFTTLGSGNPVTIPGGVQFDQTTTIYLKDAAGNAVYAIGTTVPTDSTAGYAKGCLFVDTDVAAGTSGLYVNVGTTAACNFDLVTDA